MNKRADHVRKISGYKARKKGIPTVWGEGRSPVIHYIFVTKNATSIVALVCFLTYFNLVTLLTWLLAGWRRQGMMPIIGWVW